MAAQLRFDGQTVVVTGAGGGLGKAYATFFGSRGANVVVNDLGGSHKGEGASKRAADVVVAEIKAAGGNAVANYDSVEHGDRIIDTALRAFGRVDVLVNNAGILRDVSFKNIKDQDWDLVIKVHLYGSYKCTQAAWPHFRKQKYGRIINTASAAGLFGNFGQSNYSAAKLALVGFTETLAQEGAKYNIIANVIAPLAASRMTETVMPPDVLANLKPDWIVPLVAVLTHSSNTTESGSIFEAGAGHIAKLRWQRSKGALLRPDASLTPDAIVAKWADVVDYSQPSYPKGAAPFLELLEQAQKQPPAPPAKEPINLKDKVAVITGAGGGIGRAYALLFAKLGAKVVVNDLVNPDTVVEEIRQAGGIAIPSKASCEDGPAVIKPAIDAFGRIDIVVNNAGILRDKAFTNMTDDLWNPVVNIHLRGTYAVTKAAWPYMLKQKYGRILNTTSTSGIYGKFGQANYAAAKLGILGLSRALAVEGQKYNILVNAIAPNAGTNMTRTILPEEVVQALKPDYIAPMVALLCSDAAPEPTKGLYEIGSGWFAQTRWQRTGGHGFPIDVPLTPEAVLEKWDRIVTFDDRVDYPADTQAGFESAMANMQNKSKAEPAAAPAPTGDEAILANIAKAKTAKGEGSPFDWTERDVILYALSVGATRTDLPLVYENNEHFQTLPTFGVLPWFNASMPWSLDDVVKNFSPMMLLHGEQYLEIHAHPIPTAARTLTYPRLIDVVDKGAAAIVITGFETRDAATNKLLFYNESTTFIRGSGSFGGPRKPVAPRAPAATAPNTPPKRAPDAVDAHATSPDQAALYRLNGDRNPLHIDPAFSRVGGFETPILHGLASLGVAGRQLFKRYGAFKNLKARFAGVVLPGQTLRTEFWREGGKVLFQTTVVETGKPAIVGGGAELVGGVAPKL